MGLLMPFTKGSFVEVQFIRFADPSAVIHDDPHRAQSGRPKSWSDGLSCSARNQWRVPAFRQPNCMNCGAGQRLVVWAGNRPVAEVRLTELVGENRTSDRRLRTHCEGLTNNRLDCSQPFALRLSEDQT